MHSKRITLQCSARCRQSQNSSGGACLAEQLKQRKMIQRDRIKPWNNLGRSDNATVTPCKKKKKKNSNQDKNQPRNAVGISVDAATGAQVWFQPRSTVQGLNSIRSRSIPCLRLDAAQLFKSASVIIPLRARLCGLTAEWCIACRLGNHQHFHHALTLEQQSRSAQVW